MKLWLNNPNIPLIGIEGIGGIGKSMLSAYIYEDKTIAGFTKRFWADVSSGAIFTDVATQVLQDFGFRVPEQETQLVQTLVKCLQSDEYLLIIDNLESLLKTNGIWGSQFYEDFFKTWVECGGKSKVIVTTRERPELPKRFQWLPLSGLKIADGVDLLTDLRIQGNLEEFVKLVDGYPLLLRFVADLLIEEYPQDPNLKRLENLGLGNLQQLLTDKKVVGQHRLENVGMVLVLDASFERLNELQKSLLQNISVYRGVVNAKAAMAVCLGSSETEIERELRNLVKRSFLSEKLIDDGRWFEFQPVVLEYVRYKAGDQRSAHQQAINYYQSIAKQQPWQTKDDIQEYLEIFYHFYQLADYDSAFEAIRHCNDFLTLRGYYANQVELYGQLVNKWSKTNDKENWHYTASLISLGNAYDSLGQYQRAIAFYQQSLDIAKEIGYIQGESNSLNNLGNAHYSLGQYQRAIAFHQQSLDIAKEIGDIRGESNSLGNLGNAYDSLGQYERAIAFHQQSLDIAKEIGDIRGESNSLNNLGNAYDSLGQYERAIAFYQQSLDIKKEIGDIRGESNSLNNLGNAYDSLGQYERAIAFYQQSLDIKKEIGDIQGESYSLNNLGNAYDSLGQYQRAIAFYQQSLDIKKEIGDIQGESNSLNNLGNAYKSLGQYERAIAFYQQSLDIAKKIGDIRGEANAWFNLGLSLEKVDREQDALGAYRNARELYQTMGLDTDVQDCNNAIERLSQPKKPVVSQRGFWGWLRRLWRWVRGWFRR
ncbi:Response regulator aspartate phosphatase H [Dolichospermum sp. UHCC 0315A]|uniref:tetratricopeptide repeat protein n=1 Tax=Dolichospermum sp. UHCC 0315A TaxID=1914871 RepID=UPI001257CEAE|nr:tetratricopeptide repeat protein [Dolichospermum sp. UHCC 0315A]QEI43364.1 Response regulator aspartate phosphatase H [Dolichospermum sp. UHCC 0315A]